MIKPTSLWNFIHECELEDAEYIGRICLALTGKNVEFNRAERIQYLTIAKDNDDMDERIADRKEKDRERKARWKNAVERGRTRKNAEGAESASPSIHPSIHPSVQEDTLSPAHARDGNFPTLEAVLAWAAQSVNHPDGKVYPTDWAKEWYETMRTATPPWTNVKGVSVLPNWKNAMTWAWKRHLKLDKDGKGGEDSWKKGLPPGMIYRQENYDASKGGI